MRKILLMGCVVGALINASAEGLNLMNLIPDGRPRTLQPAPRRVSMVRTPAEIRTVTNVIERVVEKPVEVVVERQVTNTVERVVEKPVEVVVERQVTNTVERVVEKPVEVVVEKPVYVTNVVEKVVVDHARETKLTEANAALEAKSGLLEAKNTNLQEDNEALKRKLKTLEERNARLQRVVPKSELKKLTGRPAKISSESTFYDRKEGYAIFSGNVYVDDEQYQLHADKAYVFFSSTNDLRRLVAMGHVAMTNDTKRAYGAKASYYRQSGMVVLYAPPGGVAEVRDESKIEDQVVKGSKIKFWTNAEQVEVLDAHISGPAAGGGDIKDALLK